MVRRRDEVDAIGLGERECIAGVWMFILMMMNNEMGGLETYIPTICCYITRISNGVQA